MPIISRRQPLMVSLAVVVSMPALGGAQVDVGSAPPPDSVLVHYAMWAWSTIGRARLSVWTGMAWNSTKRQWDLDSSWAFADDAGAQAYFIEPLLRGVLGLAQATRDTTLLDEVAQFYLDYRKRLTPVGTILAKAHRGERLSPSIPQGEPTARTLTWLDRSTAPPLPSECQLCNVQAFYPAARLVHLVAGLQANERTPTMVRFLSAYVPFLAREHLIRIAFAMHWQTGRVADLPDQRVARWAKLATGFTPPAIRYYYSFDDTDLWLLASSAELLEANHLAPGAVALGSDADSLMRLVQAGTAYLRRCTTVHQETRDFEGRVVGSLGWFEGDYDAHPDMAFAQYTDSTYPTPAASRPPVNGSWDISHIQRLPVALRSLWDARMATDLDFPDRDVLRLTINQYLYKVFRGDWRLPAFANFFDGGDGWYRVGYGGRSAWGYPPSVFCESMSQVRPCLARGAVSGWGVLAFAQADLVRLGVSLFSLAADTSMQRQSFRTRKYAVPGDRFTLLEPSQGEASALLLELVGEYLDGQLTPP